MTVTEKTLIGSVDATPTWCEMLNLMLEYVTNGTEEQRALMRLEFERMARAADGHNTMQKAMKEQMAKLAAELPSMLNKATRR